jgi:hypothetical protein
MTEISSVPPLPVVPSAPMFPLPPSSIDPDPLWSQMIVSMTQTITQSVTKTVTQSLRLYLDQRIQAQEFAAQARELEAQASRDAFERRILEKIEDDDSFLYGKVQSQKQSISSLRTSLERVSTEVTKLAEQVSLQNSLKADASDLITLDHLDEVWHHLNALQEVVFPHIDPFPPSIPSEPLRPPQFTPLTTQPLLPTSRWIENMSYSPDSTSRPIEFFSARSDPSTSAPSGYQSSISPSQCTSACNGQQSPSCCHFPCSACSFSG